MPNICVVRHIFSFQRTKVRFIKSYLHALILNILQSRQISLHSSLLTTAYLPTAYNSRSNKMRRTKLKSFYFMLKRTVLREGQAQGLQAWRREAPISSLCRDDMRCTTMRFFTSAIRERLRQRAKVKAHKLGGVRRTSVRRSNEQRRAKLKLFSLMLKRSVLRRGPRSRRTSLEERGVHSRTPQ